MPEIAVMRLFRLLRVPLALTVHELMPWKDGGRHRWLQRLRYHSVDSLIVHDSAQAERLVEEFQVPRERVWVAQHGDHRLFAKPTMPQGAARTRIGLPMEASVALFFGSIHPAIKPSQVILCPGLKAGPSRLDKPSILPGRPILHGIPR